MGATAPLVILSAVDFGLRAAQRHRQAKAADAEARTRVATQASQIELARAAEERQRQDRLRRAQATQRARFGGLGVGNGDGSAAAVLGGLERASDRRGRETNSLLDARIQGLNDLYLSRRRRNLLLDTSLDLLR